MERDDGCISVWLNCQRQAPLTFFETIPSNILARIEHPLLDHKNFRQIGLDLPLSPPNTNRVVQESPTPPLVKEQSTEGDPVSSPPPPVRPIYSSISPQPGSKYLGVVISHCCSLFYLVDDELVSSF